MRKRVYAAVALALIAGALAASVFRSEPAYKGKSLSDWIVAMGTTPEAEERQEARKAVHHLASNSIPVLLEWLQRKDSPSLKGQFCQAKADTIGWLEAHRIITPKPRTTPMDLKASYRALAEWAFEELGSDGKEAIPTLISWLGRKASSTNELDETAGAAFVTLGKLAPSSIPALTAALSSHDDQVWALAAMALAYMGPEAKSAIPALRPRLGDPNHMTRVSAADIIGRIGGDPDEFMPVLIQSLRDPNADTVSYTLDVLVHHSPRAKSALPTLLELLRKLPEPGSVTKQGMRQALLNAIRQIEPSAVPNPSEDGG